jgi:hypothetical protein
VAGNSGGSADDSKVSCSPDIVATYGRTEPGARVRIDYCGETYAEMANDEGWWLFVAKPLDDDTMPSAR